MFNRIFALALLLVVALCIVARADDVIRIPIECEDMQGVKASDAQGFTPVWTFGRWGRDLHQNMIFGGVWASRMAAAITDASDTPSEVFQDVEIPRAGHYKVWAKYEVPPFFNYPFGVRVQALGADAKPQALVFDKVYGLRASPKHVSFTDKLMTGDLYWNWGMDHDAAEGYEADLPAGKVRVTLYKAKGPAGGAVGARSVDAILITSLISTLSNGDDKADFNRFPLLDAIQKANHFYIRFKNTGSQAVLFNYNHWNHHAEFYYAMDGAKAALVRFYDPAGKLLLDDKGAPRVGPNGQWRDPVAPGALSPWMDIGPTMTTENSCPFSAFTSLPAAPAAPVYGQPFAMDLSLSPSDAGIFKSFATDPGEPQLDVLIQPDFHRAEGRETTAKTVDVFRRVTKTLDGYPRVGPIPKKLRLYGDVGVAYWGPPQTAQRPDFAPTMDYAIALGLNTIPVNVADNALTDAAIAYYKQKNEPMIELSGKYQHTQDIELLKKNFSDPKVKSRFWYDSFGDEIGLPSIDINDQKKLDAFRAYLKEQGVKPADLGVASLDTVKPLGSYSAEVAVQIGVLPKTSGAPKLPEGEAGKFIKRLYWHSSRFAIEQGIRDFADKTVAMTQFVGPHFKTTANLGGMHPFYWMHQSSFIESFKGKAMTLAWSEDYDYCQPEVTRLVIDFQAAYLRAGAKYHDTPMMFYLMPHYPGNTGQHVIQNAVTLWGQGIKDLDFFNTSIDAYGTENYIHSRGGHAETGRGIRQVSGMAGNIEDALLPARTKQARVAILLSEASDTWDVDAQGQGAVAPGSKETNATQEERKNIWYCLRNHGYLVDLLTESDVAEGRLKDYKALYVCGHNLDRHAVEPIKSWVEAGGQLMLTAGAARKDQYDEPMTDLDAMIGRGAQDAKAVFYGGPLRAKLELLQLPVLDRVGTAMGFIDDLVKTGEPAKGGKKIEDIHPASFDVLASREVVTASAGAQIAANYKNGSPAMIYKSAGKGGVVYIGALPGEAYVHKALMPARPMGKGGPEWNFSQWEPLDFDESAASFILLPVKNLGPDARTNHRGVVANILESPSATIITLVNLAKFDDGKLKGVTVTLPSLRPGKKIYTAMKQKVSVPDGKATITLSELDDADVIVIEH